MQTLFEKYLPYYQDRYNFMFCPRDRIDAVVSFIREYWNKDHIFVHSRVLLDYLHFEPDKNIYTISLAVCKKTNEIHSLVFSTLTSHFDPDICSPVRWGSMWKARNDVGEPGLGLMVEWYKNYMSSACADVGFGESKTAIRLARKTGAITGIAEQFFILNPDIKYFQIAGGENIEEGRNQFEEPGTKIIYEISPDDFIKLSSEVISTIPFYKSRLYYYNRFFRHPIYAYHASKIMDGLLCVGVFFWRICEAKGGRCIRIVDYFGEKFALSGCLHAFQSMLNVCDAEYIDILCAGMSLNEMQSAGFKERHGINGIVIPNYFEPFVQDNVDVTYSVRGAQEASVIFKGDSDQDRPNIL